MKQEYVKIPPREITDEDLLRIARKVFCGQPPPVNYFPFKDKKEVQKVWREIERKHNKLIHNPMNETVLQRIIAFVFGHKYYANIIRTRGLGGTVDLTSFIHSSKADAEAHKRDILLTASYEYVETITFRSRNLYVKTVSEDGTRTCQQIK